MRKYKWGLWCVLVIIVVGLAWVMWPRAKSPREITICSFGGTFQESQRKAFFQPFSSAEAIQIREASYSGEYSKIKAMVETRNVAWDVVDIEDPVFLLGVKEGLFEPIDYDLVNKEPLVEGMAHKFGVVANTYSTVLAYSTSVYPDKARCPRTWSDFWDLEEFPGPRALRKNPRGTLEFALLADGVGPDQLYPLDVPRALNKLDEIKSAVTVWWEQGQQPVQLLANGEVVMSSAWSGRIWNAKHISNLPLELSWQGALLEPEWWVVPAGSTNTAGAMRFIAFAARAKPQAEMAKLFGVGPSNRDAFQFLPDAVAKEIPTHESNRVQQVRIDSQWWAANEDRIRALWNEWLLKDD